MGTTRSSSLGSSGAPPRRRSTVRRMRRGTIRPVRRLLLVTHRPLDQAGGPTARWRSLRDRLPAHGWELVELSAPVGVGAVEMAGDERGRRQAAARAAVMARVGAAAGPPLRLAGGRPEALPPSLAWVPRGARGVRRALAGGGIDAVVGTGPPIAGVLAAARGAAGRAPLAVEFRDLWAGSPAFDRGGRALERVESRVVG